MRKSWYTTLCLLAAALFEITVFIGCHPEASKEEAPRQAFTQSLERDIPRWMKEYQVPGAAIALVKEGEPVWAKTWGYADQEAGRLLTLDTRCRVESISKSVTAWGVLKLVEEGRIDLNAPVTSYLKNWSFPPPAYPVKEVTVRRLLSHTAGLGLGTIGVLYPPEGPVPSLQEALSKDAILERVPGSAFSYSNAGFNLLELLIEEVTGTPFSDYMQEEVLTPLGMERSSYIWDAGWNPPLPKGYSVSGKPIPPYVYPEKGAGGLFATVEDIARFVAAEGQKGTGDSLSQKILSPRTKALLFTPQTSIPGFYGLAFPFYGFGHFIERFSDGTLAVSHGGQGSGWMSHFHLIPSAGDGIVILTNSQRSWPLFARVLREWTRWKGYSAPGMSRIIWGEWVLWGLTVGIFLLALGRGFILLKGVLRKERRFCLYLPKTPGARKPPRGFYMARVLKTTLALFLLSGLIWASAQKYLFLTAVFPVTAPALGISLLFVSLVLLWDVAVPRVVKV